jgi:hypothetical protein
MSKLDRLLRMYPTTGERMRVGLINIEPKIPMYIHHEDTNDSFIETWNRLKPKETE